MDRTLVPFILLAVIPVSLGFLPSTQTTSIQGLHTNKVVVFRASPYEVRPGGTITIDGSGFSRTANKVYFNGMEGTAADSPNGMSMTLTVPGLYEGTYNITVSNVLGSSENSSIPVSIKVTQSPHPPPTIQSASIQGGVVTLRGSGFTASNNIFTTMGTSSPVGANGDTISFNLSDLSMYDKIVELSRGVKYQAPLSIYVQNEHGINKEPYSLYITQ